MGSPSRLPPGEQAKGRYLARLQKALSIPTETDINSRKHKAFTILYIAAVTFPSIVTLISWGFLHPLRPTSRPTPLSKSVTIFVLVNINIVNSVIALLEVLLLSSVCRQKVDYLRQSDSMAD